MKLLFYSPVFPPRVGGIETIVYSIATGLAELRTPEGTPEFQITFVTQTPAGDFRDEELPFRMIREPGLGQLRKLIQATDVLHIACPALAPLVLGYLSSKPVIVEHHGFQNICPTGQLLQEPAGIPCPGHFMAGNYGECLRCRTNNNWRNSLKQWLSTFVRRWLAPRIFANIMPTDFLGQLLQLHNGVTIHHGIEINGPEPRTASIDLTSPMPIKMVYQGRLVNTKGIAVLLEAAGLLHARQRVFDLIVIGDGPERTTLENRARELRIAHMVRFLGRLSDDELATTVANAPIVIVPSLAGEVFGLVLAENMARNKAVVASNIGAFTEVLGEGGLSFRVGDAEDLAERLDTLLTQPALIPTLGQRARQRIFQSFGRTQMIAEHAALYRKALGAGR